MIIILVIYLTGFVIIDGRQLQSTSGIFILILFTYGTSKYPDMVSRCGNSTTCIANNSKITFRQDITRFITTYITPDNFSVLKVFNTFHYGQLFCSVIMLIYRSPFNTFQINSFALT